MDGDQQDAEEDERAIELSSLQAIFPELVLDSSDPFAASIALPVNPLEPLPVVFSPLAGGAPPVVPPTLQGRAKTEDEGADGTVSCIVKKLSHLPPLGLKVKLPNGYPAQKPPVFHLSTESTWLPQAITNQLETEGPKLWEEMGRDQVVYSYVDFLQQAADNAFGLAKGKGEAVQLSQELETALLDFDLRTKRTKFEQETFECGICLEPKKGSVCHRLRLCSHVFCVACLQDFYNSAIAEGDITQVKCLDPNCAKQLDEAASASAQASLQTQHKPRRKKNYTLDPSELLQIPLAEETVQRYVKLKRKKLLEANRSTVYCPRPWCQGPARTKAFDPDALDVESDFEGDEIKSASKDKTFDPNAAESSFPPPAERLAICTNCSYAFCLVCKISWHGEFANCFPRRPYELSAEEKASEKYLELHSTPCPTCDARCQKTMGCNHMICFTCNTHFCYLCSSWLSEENPYAHFNTEGSDCYMKLWELEDGDGEGARGVPARAPPPAPRRPVEDVVIQLHRPQQGPVPARAPSPPPGVRANLRVQQGLVRPRPIGGLQAQARGDPPVQGLQRFLQMVEDDNEDEWDSDELEEGVDVV